mgnify:CR=1 FL=1
MEAVLIKDTAEAKKVIDTGKVPLIVDPDGASITALKPDVVVDAILAKEKSWNEPFYDTAHGGIRSWIYGGGRCRYRHRDHAWA